MDLRDARRLNKLNRRFYQENAVSFSATRQFPWQGWQRCLNQADFLLRKRSYAKREPAMVPTIQAGSWRMLDLACGNLRFEDFLDVYCREHPSSYFTIDAGMCWAIDECEALLLSKQEFCFTHFSHECIQFDVMEALLSVLEPLQPQKGAPSIQTGTPDTSTAQVQQGVSYSFVDALGISPCDLVVCFGFMHHIPLFEARALLLETLVNTLSPGGVLCVSCWKFLDDPRLACKADEVRMRACRQPSLQEVCQGFGEGDSLLGWQENTQAFRYCHHCSDTEIERLIERVKPKAKLVGRFRAEGRSGSLNEYLIFQSILGNFATL